MDTLTARLDALDKRPTLAAYQSVARDLAAVAGALRPVKVACLSSFTINTLVPFVKVEAARLGFDADVYVGPFNAVRQELLDPGSGCARHQPDIVFITELAGDVCPPLVEDFLALAPEKVDALLDETVGTLIEHVRAYRERSRATVVLGNFCTPAAPLLGIYEEMAGASQRSAIRGLNARLVESARALPGVFVQDVDGLAAQVGRDRWHDARMWYLARAPLSADALPALAASHAAFLGALFGAPRKCLVVDLDNTLWGGVLGEQGIAGIQLGHTYPGNAYVAFQRTLLALQRRGILLAVNSKNNPEDVDEVLRSHPDMILKGEHFSAMRVNWQDKAANMMEIADELRIGTDSLVFFDDSPAECALMQRALPEVLTIQAPKEVTDYPAALARTRAFERLTLSTEDRRRTEMYRQQSERDRHMRSAASVREFLDSLQMEAEVRAVDAFSFPRVLELTQKTNQFNLTTRRYSAGELADALDGPDRRAFCLRLLDRYGDHGIVGVAIVQLIDPVSDTGVGVRCQTPVSDTGSPGGKTAVIETFLLSCRVIGRDAETALLSCVVEWARSHGAVALEGEFIPTKKNAPAADFYARHGFSAAGPTTFGTRWRLDTAAATVAWPPCIRAVPVPA